MQIRFQGINPSAHLDLERKDEMYIVGDLPCAIDPYNVESCFLHPSYPPSISRGGPFCLSCACLWSQTAPFPAGMPDLSSWHFECSLLVPLSSADPRGGHLSDGADIPSESPAGKTIVSDNPSGSLPPPSRQPKCSKPERNQKPTSRDRCLILELSPGGCELCVPETSKGNHRSF